MLDISSTNSGLLIPRVSLVGITNGVTPIAAPAVILLVYNTNAAVTGVYSIEVKICGAGGAGGVGPDCNFLMEVEVIVILEVFISAAIIKWLQMLLMET